MGPGFRRGGPVNVPTLNFAKSAKFRMGQPAAKHEVPPLCFAPVGMTELLREGMAQADRKEFKRWMRTSSGWLGRDVCPVKGPPPVAKNATRVGHPSGW